MAKVKKQQKVDDTVQPPRMGTLSNLFRGSPEEVAEIFASYGLKSTQILPVFPGLRFAGAEQVNTQDCRRMAKPFLDAGLKVAGVSAHTNFVDPDSSRKKRMIKRFDALIEHCQDFGTIYLITETGTFNPDHPWEDHPDNHQPEALEAFIKALDPSVKLAEKAGVTLLLEGYLNHVVSTVGQARSVREELGEHVSFVMDPPNYFTSSMANSSAKSLQVLFEGIGTFSPVAHAKDIQDVGRKSKMSPAGTGKLDYKRYLELLSEYQPGCPMILEQIRPEQLRQTLDFIGRFFH